MRSGRIGPVALALHDKANDHMDWQCRTMDDLRAVACEPLTPGTVAERRALVALRSAQRLRQAELERAHQVAYEAQRRLAA